MVNRQRLQTSHLLADLTTSMVFYEKELLHAILQFFYIQSIN